MVMSVIALVGLQDGIFVKAYFGYLHPSIRRTGETAWGFESPDPAAPFAHKSRIARFGFLENTEKPGLFAD